MQTQIKWTIGVIPGLVIAATGALVTPPDLQAQVPVVLICQDGSTQPASSRETCNNQDGIDWRATQKWFDMRAGRYASSDKVICKDGRKVAGAKKACASHRGLDTASTIAAIQRETKAGRAKPGSDRAAARADSSKTDSTKWGYRTDRQPDVQNPPGYRGMERPADLLEADSAAADSTPRGNAASRIDQMRRQDSLAEAGQNPPGYRGMERRAELDSAEVRSDSGTGAARPGNDTLSASGNTSRDRVRDSVDVVHRQRQVPPGVAYPPPPYPPDSERVWLEQRPSQDSVPLDTEQEKPE